MTKCDHQPYANWIRKNGKATCHKCGYWKGNYFETPGKAPATQKKITETKEVTRPQLSMGFEGIGD